MLILIGIAYSILEYLIKIPNNIILSATHYTTLSRLEIGYPKLIKNIMFDAEIINGKVKYKYKFKKGISRQQDLVFNILNEKGIPKIIIENSKLFLNIINKKNIF